VSRPRGRVGEGEGEGVEVEDEDLRDCRRRSRGAEPEEADEELTEVVR